MAQLPTPVAVVENVLDAASCDALIARIDTGAQAPTRVRDERGIRHDASLRSNTRMWFADARLAERIFAAVRSEVDALTVLAPALFSGAPRSCEATFRGYRYRVGERFAPHVDASFAIDDHARTLLTVLVYLNGVWLETGGNPPTHEMRRAPTLVGGATCFPELDLEVQPVTGRACVFPHLLLHEGAVVEHGTKYALRTNVVFS